MKKLLIIIPAYNEVETIGAVLNTLPTKLKGINTIKKLIVDDGSVDGTEDEARKYKTEVVKHIMNRGLGAAIATGFMYAKNANFDIVVTFDGDGQHHPDDIPKIIKPLLDDKADIVVGSRLLGDGYMPPLRKIINWLSNIATFLMFNIWTSDSQSGLRGFNRKAIEKIKIKSQRMEVSSEIFKEIKVKRLRMTEVPVTSIYTQYSLKKGQQITNAPKVFWKLLINSF